MKKDQKSPKDENVMESEETVSNTTEQTQTDIEDSAPVSEEAKQLEEMTKKYDEQHDLLLRTAAEYENFRKRSAVEKQNAYVIAKSDAVSQLLPVIDTLERALSVETESVEDYKKGMELTMQQLFSAFEKLGVEKISAEKGDKFDPELHNAVMHIEDDTLEQNVIAQCFQTGYRLGDKVIRHSMVQVAN